MYFFLCTSSLKICDDYLELQMDLRFMKRYTFHDVVLPRERCGTHYIALFFMEVSNKA